MGRNTSGAAVAVPFTPGRIRTGVAGVVVAVIASLALSVASAGATTGHSVSATFGIPGSADPGGFPSNSGPTGVVVDQATGDIYATDPGPTDGSPPAPRVERFDAAGNPLSEFPIDATQYNNPQSIAIDPANGSLYVGAFDASGGIVLKYALDGTPQGTLSPAAGTSFSVGALAVDPTDGDVYVGATDGAGAPLVEVFGAGGTPSAPLDVSHGGDAPFAGVTALAVDGGGRLYVTNGSRTRVDRFSTAGAFQATVVDGTLRGVTLGALAADPDSDELYVVENNSFVEYLSAGGDDHLDVFNPAGGNITGVAVNAAGVTDAADGTVYLADAAQSLGLIAAPFAGPTVTTTGSSAVGATSATFEGSVNPEGAETTYRFEYGTDGVNYGLGTFDVSAGSGTTDVPVTGTPTDPLLPNTTYHFRIVGSDPNTFGHVISGGDRTFTTDAAPPIVDGTPPFASLITDHGATLNATVNPQGTSTTYSIEYGPTATYGQTVSGAVPLEGQGDQPVSLPVTGLAPDTEYHFRVVATNGVGTDPVGADRTFFTAPAEAAGASSVTAVTADLTGTVNPHGHATTYHFEYGETGFDKSTTDRPAGSGGGPVTVTAPIDTLKPGTTYQVRVVATDGNNITTTGVAGTFTTDPAATVTTGAVTDVTPTAATFSGQVDTHDLGGTYRFYVESSTSTYISTTTTVTIPPGAAPGTVSGSLTDLRPGQTYRVRLTVLSSGYTALGDVVEFTTPEQPPLLPPPPPPPTVANPYGCAAPVLNAYNAHPKPGDTIRIAGADLGTGGSVALGAQAVTPTSWSATSLTFVVPDDAKGSLPLTVNCGKASNTIAIQMYQAPPNAFTIKSKVKKGTATLTLKVPGPGDIRVTGPDVRPVKRHVGKAGTYSVKVTLTAAGKRSVRRHRSLPRSLSVTFKPNGGTTAKKTAKVTYRR